MSLNDSYDIDALLREFRMIGRDSEYYPESEESVIPVPKAQCVPANENPSDWDKVYQDYLLTCYWAAIKNLAAQPVQPQVPLSFWVCQFCRNNGESSAFYRTHRLKDENHRVCCPVLRNYVCPICGATGDFAHTLKYCPHNTDRPSVPLITRLKGLRNSMGKRRGCGKYYPS